MYSALLNETAVESLEETYALFTRICRDTATLIWNKPMNRK